MAKYSKTLKEGLDLINARLQQELGFIAKAERNNLVTKREASFKRIDARRLHKKWRRMLRRFEVARETTEEKDSSSLPPSLGQAIHDEVWSAPRRTSDVQVVELD